jgi:replicative DNA helicase
MIRSLHATLPPQDLQAERSLIGSVLLNDRSLDDVSDVVTADCFFTEAHQAIWRVCQSLYDASKRIDAVIVSSHLKNQGELELAGGDAGLIEILETVPNACHARYYAEIVRSKFVERQLHQLCQHTLGALGDRHPDGDFDAILSSVEQQLSVIQERQLTGEEVAFGDILLESLATLEHRASHGASAAGGILTGFKDVDNITGGMRPGEMIVLAARPSMGKTAYVCNLMMHIAKSGSKCLFVSLEQSKAEVADRLLIMHSKLDGSRLAKGEMDEMEVDMLLTAANELSSMPLWIDDTPGRTMPQIMAMARRMKRRKGLDLIVIDYLQLVEPEEVRGVPREQQVAQISRRIKQLAKSLEVPVIALAQLNRAVETRPDKRPKLADLRESGSVEQDADMVLFLSRAEAYDPDDRPGEADITIAKNRNGQTGGAVLTWIKQSMRFADIERHLNLPDFDMD